MFTKNLKASLILIGVGLFLLIPPLGAQQQTGSVLSRVQTVEDPELGDLIRVAIENCERTGIPPNERPRIVQDVTEAYAKIKLLDEQIEQTSRKIKGGGAAEVQQEMVLAKAELESKRMIELGRLRQIMGVIPAHAFGRRPTGELETWLHLNVAGDRIILCQPLQVQSSNEYSLIGVMSKSRALEYVAEQLKGQSHFPMRIDIHRTVDGSPLAEQLEAEVVQLVKKDKAEMQTEVHKDAAPHEEASFGLMIDEGEVGTGRGTGVRRLPSGQLVPRQQQLSGIIEPNSIGRQVERWLARPVSVPAVFTIEYPSVSETLANEVIQAISDTARRLGLSELVEIKRNLRQAKPEELYMGRWEARRDDGEAITIVLEAHQSCLVIEGEKQIRASWAPNGDGLVVIGESLQLSGAFDSQGHLIINHRERRTVDAQGEHRTIVEQNPVTFTRVK
jgi:hypothetical protein